MSNPTVLLSPGSSDIFSKPLSSRTGLERLPKTSWMYIWTTSLPATEPVLVTVTEALMLPSSVIEPEDRVTGPYSKAVYERPYPNG